LAAVAAGGTGFVGASAAGSAHGSTALARHTVRHMRFIMASTLAPEPGKINP